MGSYALQLGPITDLKPSGQVQIIGNKDLRRALATSRQRIDRMEAWQRDFRQSQQMLMGPFLVDNLNLSALLPDRITAQAPDLSMLGSSEFQGRLAFRIRLRSLLRRSQDEVRAAFTEALLLIEAEIHAKDGA